MGHEKPKRPGSIGNQRAAKEITLDAQFTGRCISQEKSSWVKAANRRGMKLVPWIREILNQAAQEEFNKK